MDCHECVLLQARRQMVVRGAGLAKPAFTFTSTGGKRDSQNKCIEMRYCEACLSPLVKMVEIQDRSVKSEILTDDLNFDAGNERKYTKKTIMNSVTLHKVKGVKSTAV